MRLLPSRLSLFGLFAAVLLSGCAASAPSALSPEQASRVVGVWEYDVSGSPHLERGMLEIQLRNGRLTGTVRDQRRGRMAAQVRMHGSRFEMRVDDLYVSGHVEDNRLQAFCRRPMWDVSTSQDIGRMRQAQRASSARLIARRVASFSSVTGTSASRCEPLLEEVDYRCTTSLRP